MTEDNAPIPAETNIIGNNRRVSRYAVAAGVTSMAAARLTPTVCSETTTVSASNTNMRLRRSSAGNLNVAARTGSKEMTRKGLYNTATVSRMAKLKPPINHKSEALTPNTLPNKM